MGVSIPRLRAYTPRAPRVKRSPPDVAPSPDPEQLRAIYRVLILRVLCPPLAYWGRRDVLYSLP